ncbi:MAG: hypothetical protein HKN43_14440 [Rhodothermales bacterium]|nr:hypothetical protein [Rhodothermales bacterium]
MKSTDDWTRLHDLAMVFLALAYGTDKVLSDEELDTIVDVLRDWRGDLEVKVVQEVVVETLAVFLEGSPNDEVVDSIISLSKSLSREERIRAIEDAVRIAKADGIVLGSEQTLISSLATTWKIKTDMRVQDAMSVGTHNRPEGWTLLHDIGLLYVVIAHGGDNRLDEREITAMIDRMSPWSPELDEGGIRKILRTALSFYASEPGPEALRESVASIEDSLPAPQRLAVLDDLIHIAGADGHVNDNEKEMIESLARTLDVNVNLTEVD